MQPSLLRSLLAWGFVGSCQALNALPSNDPFYDPPEGWQEKQHGEILKTRYSAYQLPTAIENVQDTFQVMYRSYDSYGNDTWGVTTVFIPNGHTIEGCKIAVNGPGAAGADEVETETEAAAETDTEQRAVETDAQADAEPKCSHAMVVYQVPYDTVNPNSPASYLAQFGEAYGDVRLSLARGWFVSLTDYEGPLAAFSAGVQAGRSILDSIPAALQVARAHYGFAGNDTTTALWGYSGGGQAAGMAAELAPTYAPDLHLAGAVVGGPPPDLRACIDLVNERETSGLLVASLIGITVQQPAVCQDLLSRLKEEGEFNRTGFLMGYRLTGHQAIVYFIDKDVYAYFENGYDDVWTPPVIDIYDHDGVLGKHGTPDIPVFIHLAVNDGFFHINDADDLVQSYCDRGANILYHRNIVGHHKDELNNGRQRAINYLAYVLDGERGEIEVPESGCVWKDVSEWVLDTSTIH